MQPTRTPADIILAASVLQETCHALAAKAGWWIDPKTDKPVTQNPLCFSNKLMLVVSELSEALEADRKNLFDSHLPTRLGAEVELADAVIRIFDMAGGFGFDLPGAIAEKLSYNARRADHKLENRKADNGKKY